MALNRIALIGNLGRDPEMSYTQAGKAVAKFSIAVTRRYKGAGGERQEQTTWFNLVAWERLAETCNEYLHKGSKVYVAGRMESHSYTGKDGVERTAWEVTLEHMEMLDGKAPNGQPAPGGDMTPDDIPF